MSAVFLFIQTLFLWCLVVILYSLRKRYSLLLLYGYLAIITVLTHNLSDLGFSLQIGRWDFFIGSVSFFTTLMFITLFLYLLEGPKAARLAIITIFGSSILYFILVFLLSLQVNTGNWVPVNFDTYKTYFWSLLAIMVDVSLLALFWEVLTRISKIPLVIKVFLVSLLVLLTDTLIFTTGVFLKSPEYLQILNANLLVRLGLAVFIAPIISAFVRFEGFNENTRLTPKNLLEILNFQSDLETQIESLEDVIKQKDKIQKDLLSSKETYELVLTGSGGGIWDWDMVKNTIYYSPKFLELLGYKSGDLDGSLEQFKTLIHPEDFKSTFQVLNEALSSNKNFEHEYRLKHRSGEYTWFLVSGIAKFDSTIHRPVRMAGTIIDIQATKQGEIELRKKIAELSELNKAMVDRELKMVELKERLKTYESHSD